MEPNYTYTILKTDVGTAVKVSLVNKSQGATRYKWTFEGGTPASSAQKDPGTVVFQKPGSHLVTLEAWNEDDRKTRAVIL